MAELKIEDLIKAIYEQGQRAPRNPARNLSTAQSDYREIPIAIRSGVAGFVTDPRWGDLVLSNHVYDHFTNTGNTDVDLSTHTSDSGDTWTDHGGTFNVTTADYAEKAGVDHSWYSVNLGSASARISVVTPAALSNAGFMFRFQDTDNYWRIFATGGNYDLQRIVGGAITWSQADMAAIAAGDLLQVDCIGDFIIIRINHTIVHIREDSTLNTQTRFGFVSEGGGSARFDDFHAWEITGTDIDFTTDPGHTFWHGPETWT